MKNIKKFRVYGIDYKSLYFSSYSEIILSIIFYNLVRKSSTFQYSILQRNVTTNNLLVIVNKDRYLQEVSSFVINEENNINP